ncbi:hypothetical protein [Fimbriiglobus ruber]|uniref:Uncharacterized protein n=1 Tax=Fimbriiglobus ruber TaxID=1908690 RepID=A0A225E4H7_9BACT|nr:hypothetical protein [Fimbriiglobus ruber]OWK44976.1 hypothetical protein FRUB_01307 [Fimbriiglobus ruber]
MSTLTLLRRLWDDDRGAIVTTEIILIMGILVFGLIPGLIAVRNSGNATLATLGNILLNIIPSFTFSGFSIAAAGGGTTSVIVQVGGVSYSGNSVSLTSYEVAPTQLNTHNIGVSPTP